MGSTKPSGPRPHQTLINNAFSAIAALVDEQGSDEIASNLNTLVDQSNAIGEGVELPYANSEVEVSFDIVNNWFDTLELSAEAKAFYNAALDIIWLAIHA